MKKILAILLTLMLTLSAVCVSAEATVVSDKEAIETALNLKNNPDQEWTYSASADAWTLSIVSAVLYPVLENEEGVSVCVPGAYVTGIDTDGDGTADVTAETASEAVKGSLVIDDDATVTSTHGQTYTAATAPVILNTGAAGYGNSSNTTASSAYAAEGYINVACGNRGKQDTYTDADGNTVYTGDAPSCLVDQKAAAEKQTANGDSESASGTDLSGWVSLDENGTVSFTLSDLMAYRTQGASKATPGFDVIDYGQEDYVFGSTAKDARHWSVWVLKALEEHAEELEALFAK